MCAQLQESRSIERSHAPLTAYLKKNGEFDGSLQNAHGFPASRQGGSSILSSVTVCSLFALILVLLSASSVDCELVEGKSCIY